VRVAENLVVQNGVIQWNVIFTRPVQDWEMEMVPSFFLSFFFFFFFRSALFYFDSTWRG